MEGGTKVYINGPGHILKFGMEHYVLKLYKGYINNDPEFTLNYFTRMSNLAKLVWDNVTMMNILEIIAACDLEVD